MDEKAIAWFSAHSGELLDHLIRHLVALRWTHALSEPRPDRPTAVSKYDVRIEFGTSFIVSTQHMWFLMTAGHVLRQVEADRTPPRRLILFELLDGSEPGVVGDPVRLDFGDTWAPYWDHAESGMDYGVIALNSDVVRLLEAKGKLPVSPSQWTEVVPFPSFLVLLGFPREHRYPTAPHESATQARGQTHVATPLLPLELVDDSYAHEPRRIRRFRARIVPKLSQSGGLLDINGMSGGPNFAVQPNDAGASISLVAIQSEWDKASQIVTACFAQPVLGVLDRKVSELVAARGFGGMCASQMQSP